MLKSYLKIAWRNLAREKAYTIINVIGLSLGLCGCMVIYVIAHCEFSFDNFHPGKEAAPIAWYFMNQWLQNFAYRTNIGWTVLVLAGFTATFIMLVTVGIQSIRAALANPARSLRTQ